MYDQQINVLSIFILCIYCICVFVLVKKGLGLKGVISYKHNYLSVYQSIYLSISKYIYGIHIWGILWSSYRKLSWVRYELTTTSFIKPILLDVRCNFNVTFLRSLYIKAIRFRNFLLVDNFENFGILVYFVKGNFLLMISLIVVKTMFQMNYFLN